MTPAEQLLHDITTGFYDMHTRVARVMRAMVTCPNCGGSCSEVREHRIEHGTRWELIDCHTCRGLGAITVERYTEKT